MFIFEDLNENFMHFLDFELEMHLSGNYYYYFLSSQIWMKRFNLVKEINVIQSKLTLKTTNVINTFI